MSIQPDPLRARGSDVAALGDTLRRGGAALESVPEQIKQLLRSGDWRHFVTRLGNEVQHGRFADFVTTPPLAGLGGTVELIKRLVKGDPEAEDLLDRELQKPTGGSQEIILNDAIMNNENDHGRPHGSSRAYALRKLRKDRPELHAEVLAGNISAHAAMVAAGFRPKTFSVRTDNPQSVLRALKGNTSPEFWSELKVLILAEDAA